MTPTLPPASPPPDPATVQRIRNLACELIGTDAGRDAWLSRPNPELGGRSPNDLVAAGRADVVERYIQANLNGDSG